MSIIQVSDKFLVVGLKGYLVVFCKSSGKCNKLIHEFKTTENSKENNQGLDYAVFSPNYKYFAALFSDKTLSVWSTNTEDGPWVKIGVVDVKRRSVSIAFSPDESNVFVADKSGDLYKFPIQDGKLECLKPDEIEPILGHISMMLDVAITDQLIVTADRDEKIRISDLEFPYLIRNFCLGHTDFVYKISLLKSRNVLLSVSGDTTLKVWDVKTGQESQSFKLTEQVSSDKTTETSKKPFPAILTCSKDEKRVAVGCVDTDSPSLELFSVSSNKGNHILPAYKISMENCVQVLSATFDSIDSSLLYVLAVQSLNLTVLVYNCNDTNYAIADVTPTIEAINEYLKSIPLLDLTDKEYPQLFKACVAGHKYDAFFNKKKKLQAKTAEMSKAKVPKLDTEVTSS